MIEPTTNFCPMIEPTSYLQQSDPIHFVWFHGYGAQTVCGLLPGSPEMGQAQFLSTKTPKSAVGDRVSKEHRKVLLANEKTSGRR